MEQIRFYAKAASGALLRWSMLFGSGLLLSIVGLVVSLRLLGKGATDTGWTTAAGQAPWSTALFLGSLLLPAVYFVLANKITLGFVLYGLFDHKLLPLIGDKVAGLVGNFITRQSVLGEVLASVPKLRDKLVALAGEDSTLNRIQRQAVRYGLARIRLDDIDFGRPDINLPGVVAGRVVEKLQAAAEPGYQLIWVVTTAHAALLALALFFNRT